MLRQELEDIMTKNNFQLKSTIISRALELFALGKSRAQVAECLLNEDPIPKDLEQLLSNTTKQEAKKILLDKLRTVDPTSTRFAKSKYRIEYDDIRTEVMRALAQQGNQLVVNQFQNLKENDTQLTQLINNLMQQLLQTSAEHMTPKNNTEYINTIKVVTNLCNAQSQNTDKLSHLTDYFNRLKGSF